MRGGIVANLADIIEEFILRRLSGEQDNIVVLRRNELAEKMDCAPSQVSYVLNTRFTVDRGFIVESRRGLGGFIRIARVPVSEIVYDDATKHIDEYTSYEDLTGIIGNLVMHEIISEREAALLQRIFSLLYEKLPPAARATIIRSIFTALADLP